ncbi:hypothetical protein [Brevifollis gellanilyticus]|uniref:Uncharacterized protein n=1 Tax=Brevifollis gellanilyticus TaxID=748831 RepID=A0A512M4Q0_9BACT|nr:hypothetical protein [Brevifollis gellanilyticus]GEP41724.1 hypothetical protein BGE01nite_10150 [Brevifollis gellanilyticus]
MKTKLTFLIALAIASTLQAQKPAFNQAPRSVPQASRMPVTKAPVATPRSVPAYRAPAIRGSAPQIIRSFTPPPPPRATTSRTLKPATAPRAALPNQKNVIQKPGLSNPAPALNDRNMAAIHEGARITESLRSLDDIRKTFPDALRDKYNLGQNNKGSNNGFQMPLDRDGTATREFTPREVKGPSDHPTNRSGLTDIRGGRERAQRGLSREVTTNPDGSTTELVKRHDGDGQVIQYDRTTRDSSGTITRVEQNEINSDGVVTAHRADRTANGDYVHSVTLTRPDGTGNLGSVWRSADPWFCDRSPEEISTGGPVNGSGPSVIETAGLVPLDLLRQHANGEAPGGGTNFMTSGRLNRNHTNPASIDGAGSLPSTANRHRVPVDNSNLAGPSSGGSTGGGDRPD